MKSFILKFTALLLAGILLAAAPVSAGCNVNAGIAVCNDDTADPDIIVPI